MPRSLCASKLRPYRTSGGGLLETTFYKSSLSHCGMKVFYRLYFTMKKYHAIILVIEDDPNDQILIERAFRAVGVVDPIQIVNDGAEAIAYMMGEGKYSDRQKFTYPTFVVTDLKMPHADGFAVLEFLKSNPEWA